ncbi:MAG TPA: hypothetical protein VMB26_02410 [Candidatus Binataceae bacterium]|nr:hypothetical protein [Candidatus Binataceae bacterium]
MTTRLIVAVVTLAVVGICTPQTLRAASSSKRKASERALEARLELLEQENRQLEQQNRAIQNQLSAQTEEIGALKQQLDRTARPVAALQQDVPQLQTRIANVENKRNQLPFEVGFRTGWSESPYKMPGGFFYSAFLNHRLLDHEDGIPGGFVSGELLAGATLGNHAVTSANLLSQLAPAVGPQSTWLQTVQIVPTVQYHVDPALFGYEPWAWAKPYLLAGPAIYISMLSTPVVVKGDQPGAGYRHTDADLQGGGAFGFGTELALSRLAVAPIQKILDRSFVGAEWRYNQMGNGEGFNQYTGSVAFGW